MADPKLIRSAWQRQKEAANRHYQPGKFTTLIAFEWTSIPYSQNLHHNVFFRDDKGPDMPFSAFDSVKREDLWTYQEDHLDRITTTHETLQPSIHEAESAPSPTQHTLGTATRNNSSISFNIQNWLFVLVLD